MFLERQIADGFWYFVRGRAIDWRVSHTRTRAGSRTLDKLEIKQSQMRYELAPDDGRKDDNQRLFEDDYLPWTYPTVQDALAAYLINQTALSLFPYPYEMWLRAITLIIADAQRDPGYLHVIACDFDEANSNDEPPDSELQRKGYQTPHDMTISDDWSCLSRETFDFIVREYAGKG